MKVKGSFTIEASLIFPMTSFILIIVLFICIYMHDKACLQNIANLAILEIKNIYEDSDYYTRLNQGLYIQPSNSEKINKIATEFIYNKANDNLILKNSKNINVNISILPSGFSNKVKIYIFNNYKLPFNFGLSIIKLEIYSEGQLLFPGSFINGIDVLNDISDNIAAIKSFKDKYHEILENIEEIIYSWI